MPARPHSLTPNIFPKCSRILLEQDLHFDRKVYGNVDESNLKENITIEILILNAGWMEPLYISQNQSISLIIMVIRKSLFFRSWDDEKKEKKNPVQSREEINENGFNV